MHDASLYRQTCCALRPGDYLLLHQSLMRRNFAEAQESAQGTGRRKRNKHKYAASASCWAYWSSFPGRIGVWPPPEHASARLAAQQMVSLRSSGAWPRSPAGLCAHLQRRGPTWSIPLKGYICQLKSARVFSDRMQLVPGTADLRAIQDFPHLLRQDGQGERLGQEVHRR